MQINSVTVVNAGPFERFHAQLVNGSIGLFGRNGCGKTSLVRLMHAALTRRFGMFPGVKADLALSTASARDPSYVELQASHAGVEFEVTLSLRDRKSGPHRSRLKVAGEPELTGEPEIVERLTGLGLPAAVLDASVFVYDVYGFIDLTPAKRADVYRTLCGTERAAEVHRCLSRALSDLQAPEADEAVDGLVASVASARAEQATLQSSLDALKAKAGKQKNLVRARRCLARRRRAQRAADDLARGEEAYARESDAAGRAVNEADDLRARWIAARDKAEAADAKAKRALDLLSALDEQSRFDAEEARLRAEVAKFAKPGCCPAEPEDAYTADAAAEELAAVCARQKAVEELLSSRHRVKGGTCPTCGQGVTHGQEFYDALGAERAANVLRACELEDVLARAREYREERAAYDVAESRRLALLERASDALAALAAPSPRVNVERSKLTAAVRSAETAAAVTASLADRLAAADLAAATAAGRRDSAAAALEAFREAVSEVGAPPDDDRVALANRVVQFHEKLALRVANLEGQLRAAVRELKRLQSELTAAKARAAVGQRTRQLRAIYERAVDLTHWDGLPKRVASLTLGRMEGIVNDTLRLFGSPFSVTATDSMSFDCAVGDAPPRDMVWLSSGQRALLAVSFWQAASVFAAALGLLVLDEPTANLDAANVEYLAAALTSLTASVRGNRQVIMTTHADGLRASFDQVVEVE